MPQFVPVNSVPIVAAAPPLVIPVSSVVQLTPTQSAAANAANAAAGAAQVAAAGVAIANDAYAISPSTTQTSGSVSAQVGNLVNAAQAAIPTLASTDPAVTVLQDLVTRLSNVSAQLDPVQADLVTQSNVLRAATATSSPAALSAAAQAVANDRATIGTMASPTAGSVQQVLATAKLLFTNAAQSTTGSAQAANQSAAAGMTALATHLDSIGTDLDTQIAKAQGGIAILSNAQTGSTSPATPAPGTTTVTTTPTSTAVTTTAPATSTGTTVAIAAGVAGVVGLGLYAVYAMRGAAVAGAALENPIPFRMRASNEWTYGYNYKIKKVGRSYLVYDSGHLVFETNLLTAAKRYVMRADRAAEFPKSGVIAWGPGPAQAKRT
jgi:hypothetical protein